MLIEGQPAAHRAVIRLGATMNDVGPDGRTIQSRPQELGSHRPIGLPHHGRRSPEGRHQRPAIDRTGKDPKAFTNQPARTAREAVWKEVAVEPRITLGGVLGISSGDRYRCRGFKWRPFGRCRELVVNAQEHLGIAPLERDD